MKVSIVAAYNTQIDMTNEFLDRMEWSVEDELIDIEMILVHGYVAEEPDIKHDFIDKFIRVKNETFCKTLNKGLEAVSEDSDYIFFVGNDSFPVEKGWLSKLIKLHIETDAKIVCPANDKPGMAAYKHLYKGESDVAWVCDFFPSVAWLIPSEVFKEIGLLDERYVASCMYVDNDYCMHIQKKYGPLQIIVSKDILLEHRVSVEGKILHNNARDMQVNCKIFQEKWSEKK